MSPRPPRWCSRKGAVGDLDEKKRFFEGREARRVEKFSRVKYEGAERTKKEKMQPRGNSALFPVLPTHSAAPTAGARPRRDEDFETAAAPDAEARPWPSSSSLMVTCAGGGVDGGGFEADEAWSLTTPPVAANSAACSLPWSSECFLLPSLSLLLKVGESMAGKRERERERGGFSLASNPKDAFEAR